MERKTQWMVCNKSKYVYRCDAKPNDYRQKICQCCLLQNIVDVYNAKDGWYFPCLFI